MKKEGLGRGLGALWQVGRSVPSSCSIRSKCIHTVEREIDSALFERQVLSPPIVSPAVAQIHPTAAFSAPLAVQDALLRRAFK